MKNLIILLCLTLASLSQAQTKIDSTFVNDSKYLFNNFEESKYLNISGSIELYGKNSFVRIILDLKDGRELLMYEANPLITEDNTVQFINACEETSEFDTGTLECLKIEITNAKCHISSVKTNPDNELKSTTEVTTKKSKIEIINENLQNEGALWIAGETSFSRLSYSEKKKLFNNSLPNLQGLEYYKGGIFILNSSNTEQLKSNGDQSSELPDEQYIPWADEFSYIDLHDANNPESFYYNNNAGEQGWITTVKNQGPAGACWAFSAIAALEARANLYYNQHLSLDLSEQQLISCSQAGNIAGGYAEIALQWTALYGSINESCFPYQATDADSSLICGSPEEIIKPEGVVWYTQHDYLFYESGLKRMLINKSPIALNIDSWNHSMLLVGYNTLTQNDNLKAPVDGNIQSGLETIIIDAQSELLGKTCWKIKNSWGADWGENGFLNMIIEDYNDLDRCSAPAGLFSSTNLKPSDIKYYDKDGDGYYNWGIGERPDSCSNNMEEDGNDNNPLYGPRDDYGNLTLIGELANVTISCPNILSGSFSPSLTGLPTEAELTFWSVSPNLQITDGGTTESPTITLLKDNGLASVSISFSYKNKTYKKTKNIATSEGEILFAEQKNVLPPAVTATYLVADFDMDKDFDLIYSGRTGYDYAKIIGGYGSWDAYSCFYFENNNGLKRDTTTIPYTGGQNQQMAVNDLNNDQVPDFSIYSENAFDEDWHYMYRKIFYSANNKPFINIEDQNSSNIDPGIWGFFDWFDFNNDGNLDIGKGEWNFMYYPSNTNNSHEFKNYQNTITNYSNTFGAGDFNNNGKVDIISMPMMLFKDSVNFDYNLRLYDIHSTDDAVLLSESEIELPTTNFDYLSSGTLKTADFNNDGFLDIVTSFTMSPDYTLEVKEAIGGGIITIYLNNKQNGFVAKPITLSNEFDDDLFGATFVTGDFTNDNFVDIIYTGSTGFDENIRRVYLLINDGEGNFTSKILNLGGTEHVSSLNAADFDSDGNLDFLISGANGLYMGCGAGKTEIMLNKSSIEEGIKPNAPANLSVTSEIDGEHIFTWDKLAEGGYSYNIKIGTTPGGGEIVSCNAMADGDLTVPKHGNCGVTGLYKLNRELPSGTYYWTVQAIDNAFRGGTFTEPQTFQVIVTSTEQITQNLNDGINVYPNPAKNIIQISGLDAAKTTEIIINNMFGKTIYRNPHFTNQSIDISNQSDGLYFVTVITDKTETFKIVKSSF